MSEITRRTVALDAALVFNAPPIKIYARPSQFGLEWRCDIDFGVGYYGIGDSPAEALMRAARLACQAYFERDPL